MDSTREYINLEVSLCRRDSSGEFQMMAAQMRAALGPSPLADDSSMILKLIQGCVGLGGVGISLDSTDLQLDLFCQHGNPQLAVNAIWDQWQTISAGLPDLPAADLVTGLLHRPEPELQALALTLWVDGSHQETHQLVGPVIERVAAAPGGATTGFAVHFRLQPEAIAFQVNEAACASRLFYCPAPVYLQGKLLGWSDESPCSDRVLLEYYRTDRHPTLGAIGPRWRGSTYYSIGHSIYRQNDICYRDNDPLMQGGSLTDGDRMRASSLLRFIGNPEVDSRPATFEAKKGQGMREQLQSLKGGLDPDEPVPYAIAALYLGYPTSARLNKVSICAVKRGIVLPPTVVEMPCPPAAVFLACDDLVSDLSGSNLSVEQVSSLVDRAFDVICEGLQICKRHKHLIHEIQLVAPSDATGIVADGVATLFHPQTSTRKPLDDALIGLCTIALGTLAMGGLLAWDYFTGHSQRGKEIARQMAELAQSLQSDPTIDPCPACSSPMLAASEGRQCPACGGRMVRRGEPALALATELRPKHPPDAIASPGERVCPDCHVRMSVCSDSDFEECRLCGGKFMP